MGILYKWSKGLSKFLDDSLEGDLAIAAMSAAEEYKAIQDYTERLKSIKDENLKEIINEIIMDESHHYQNLMASIKKFLKNEDIDYADIEKMAYQAVGDNYTSGQGNVEKRTGPDPTAVRSGEVRTTGEPEPVHGLQSPPGEKYKGKKRKNFQDMRTIEEIGEAK